MDLSRQKKKKIKEYYLQDDIVKEMVRVSEYREFAPTYPQGYGSRPDSINYPSDFRSYVEKGAVAFHGSVERWKNPLLIGKIDMEKLRKGWDLVIDIDADEGMIYAKEAALKIINEWKEVFQISEENISVKFSGNRGFHLGIRNEAFPDKIGGKKFAEWYPALPQAIVGYMRDRIESFLEEKFIEIDPELEETIRERDVFEIADVENDWGQRHLFRLPYSLNEKSWLVAKPIEIEEIRDFDKHEDAKMEEVEVRTKFLDSYKKNDQGIEDLCVEALDWLATKRRKHQKEKEKRTKGQDYELPDEALDMKHFPPPIKRIMEGLDDGRKRALFILITFLIHTGYDWDALEKEIWDWNTRNKEELRENYVKSQLQWHKNQEEPLMPPNFDSKGWYRDIGVIDKDEDQQMLENFDNPVPYAFVLKKKSENSEEDD